VKEVLSILVLCIPLFAELWNDRNGDAHHATDVVVRWIIAAFSAAVVWWLLSPHSWWSAAFLSLAIHFFFFDYLENILLIRNHVITSGAHWFTYLGKSSKEDKFKLWRKIGPYGRLAVRAVVLITAIYFYV